MKTIHNPSISAWPELLKRPSLDSSSMHTAIEEIFATVEKQGDGALKAYTRKFDKVAIHTFQVSEKDIEEAITNLDKTLRQAIEKAYQNIYQFHMSQKLSSEKVQTSTGVTCWQDSLPIEKVGLYIPGGTAPLFSTVLMLAIPAKIAGCEEVILCSPPGEDGKIDPAIIFTAYICGVHKIYTLGGAQAIAAMTIGTQSVPKVHKIFGPGNQYVTAAKIRAFEKGVAIDLPAGPSEALVYADNTANPEFVAADLLSQAEHGVDSQVVLVTEERSFINQVNQQLAKQLQILPRKDIAAKALENSFAVTFKDVNSSFDFINQYAPEHFIIASDRADNYIKFIKNAGSVFLGNYSPESAGDYASGTNHTLPTSGYAKAFSGVNLDAFVKKITFQHITKQGILELGPTIETMAKAESLDGHAHAVRLRINHIKQKDNV